LELGVNLGKTGKVESMATQPLSEGWKSLRLDTASFTYQGSGDRTFTAGPIDLTIHRGEVLFITGANGSGKTTLGKMLIGLYEPDSGSLMLDTTEIGYNNRDAFRQHNSAVFPDFHLFDDLAGLHENETLRLRAREFLEALGLAESVTLDSHGRLSTTSELSTGQKKRLALLSVYLEDRDLVLFDEWAADQDPEFRTVFYDKLLPDFSARGKTVIVITHDDRYFRCAERLVKLADGRLVECAVPAEDYDWQVMAAAQ